MRTLLICTFAFAFVAVPAAAKDDPKVSAEVMAIARAQIAAGIAQKPWAERMAAIADDYTLFNVFAPTRIEGKANVVSLNTANDAGGGKTLATEMLNSRVQVYGDTAILTFNAYSINQDKDGKTMPGTSKVTRVYVRDGGAWKNVHSHFSSVTPPAN